MIIGVALIRAFSLGQSLCEGKAGRMFEAASLCCQRMFRNIVLKENPLDLASKTQLVPSSQAIIIKKLQILLLFANFYKLFVIYNYAGCFCVYFY